MEILEKLWEDKKDVIRLRFVKNSEYKYINRLMIKKIDDHFALKKEARKVLDKNSTWFTYRLLDDESKRIMTDSLVLSLIPFELHTIAANTQKLVQKICSTGV